MLSAKSGNQAKRTWREDALVDDAAVLREPTVPLLSKLAFWRSAPVSEQNVMLNPMNANTDSELMVVDDDEAEEETER